MKKKIIIILLTYTFINKSNIQTEGNFKKIGAEFSKGFLETAEEKLSKIDFNFKSNFKSVIIENLIAIGGISLASFFIGLVLKHGVDLAFKIIKRVISKPKLIIDSYKRGWFDFLRNKPVEKPIIFAQKLEERLNKIVAVTSVINNKIKNGKKNVKYRNLMLYGPPGTGKTLFATELAKRSGMEYVFMSGSSFSKFKDGEGIEALDELFAWANKSKGLLIFIDEAETFLSKRENMDPQSKSYQLLNNFLNYTGTKSDKFMLVFATNHKDNLDSAMYRRIDDLIEMPLPGLQEREGIIQLYADKILFNPKENTPELVSSSKQILTNNTIKEIAHKTKGLSGGDIESIINAIKTDAGLLDPEIISKELVDIVVNQAIEKHRAFTHGKHLGLIED